MICERRVSDQVIEAVDPGVDGVAIGLGVDSELRGWLGDEEGGKEEEDDAHSLAISFYAKKSPRLDVSHGHL